MENNREKVLSTRKEQILLTVIQKYLDSAVPVSSQAIAEHYSFQLSSATIRSELAALADYGYLHQPHTSAGRMPTEKGYRYYVDVLMNQEILQPQEEVAIKQLISLLNRELEDLLMESSALLSRLTNYTALAVIPATKKPQWKHLDILSTEANQLMVILIGKRGEIRKHFVDVHSHFSENDLVQVERAINDHFKKNEDSSLPEADKMTALNRPIQAALIRQIAELMEDRESGESKMVVEGTHHFLDKPEFSDIMRLQPIFSALEERFSLIKLLQRSAIPDQVVVKIGSEIYPFDDCSFVGAPYRFGNEAVGTIGVLGPTRMNYARAVAAVENVALSLSRALGKLH